MKERTYLGIQNNIDNIERYQCTVPQKADCGEWMSQRPACRWLMWTAALWPPWLRAVHHRHRMCLHNSHNYIITEFWYITRGGEISKMYNCSRTIGLKKTTCPYQCTTCPYLNKYKCKYFNIMIK